MVLAASSAARADVILTLTDPNPSALPGTVVTVLATAFNNDANTVFLNGISLNADSPLTVDDSPFLNNWFSIAGNSFFDPNPQPLFTITVPLGATFGPYAVTVTLLGGPDPGDQNILNTTPALTVNVNVSDVPEPGSFLLVTCGLVFGIWRGRRAAL
jgi:hypothetical protein